MPAGAAFPGPVVVFREGGDTGPSLFDRGLMLLDPRSPYNYQPGAAVSGRGWLNSEVVGIDAVPSTAAANNIAANQGGSGAGTFTLVSSSGAGIVVGASVVNALTGITDTGLLAIEQAMTPVTLGPVQAWDPTKAITRGLRMVDTAGGNTGITITIRGYDLYGFPLTEALAGPASGATVNFKKAFKYIKTVSRSATVTGNLSIGTTDIVGLPFRCDNWGYAQIVFNNAFVTANTGFVAADTNTATASTGDVRGTYTVQGGSDGVKRLVIFQSIPVSNVGTDTGMFGVTQFSG